MFKTINYRHLPDHALRESSRGSCSSTIRQALLLRCATAVAIALATAPAAIAGPPFLTDDPEPVPYHHWESYLFATRDETQGADSLAGPAVELNNGIAPNTQVHLIVPEATFSQDGESARGIGDVEVGVKYRLLGQTASRPDVGLFPLAELPSGDATKGLGNGRAWYKIPLWAQKDWGPWTTYGGGGYAVNSAPGQKNYGFGGWLLQRTLSPALSLGGELFVQGASANAPSPASGQPTSEQQVIGARSTAIWNVGGTYNFTPDFSLLFTGGHSFEGEGNSVLYIGLYRTWGPGSP
jgi:hypothetical protein